MTIEESDTLGQPISEVGFTMVQGATKWFPVSKTVNAGSGQYMEAYHPAGEGGALRGIGSVAVNLIQWYFQRAGKCTSSCHFLET